MPAVSYQKFERRIRALLRDTRQTDFVCDPDMLFHAVARAVQAVVQKINPAPTLNTSFLTLAANTYSYAVGSGFNSTQFTGFRLLSTGQPIVKKDLPVLMEYRTGSTVDTGDPLIIAFSETSAGVYTAYLWPTPWQADTVEATHNPASTYTDPTFNSSGLLLYASTIDLPGSSELPVLYRASMELLMMLGPDRLDKLGVTPAAVDRLGTLYEDTLNEAVHERAVIRRAGDVVVRNPF